MQGCKGGRKTPETRHKKVNDEGKINTVDGTEGKRKRRLLNCPALLKKEN